MLFIVIYFVQGKQVRFPKRFFTINHLRLRYLVINSFVLSKYYFLCDFTYYFLTSYFLINTN